MDHIQRYLEKHYPRPRVDPEWLQGCYQWLIEQPNADPHSQQFLQDVEAQLLQSDLTDSMLQNTGLPTHISQTDHQEANTRLTGPPVLVEIVALTEIASSAYQLDQVRMVREERLRLGQAEDDQEGEGDLEVEGEGPVPKYPRGMLRFQLSDGATTLSAIEFRSLPELVLGQTKLGFKMLLKNPMMRHGIAFLEPATTILLGYQTDDREAQQHFDFARGLRVRMGLPIEPDNPPDNPFQPQPQPQLQHAATAQPTMRSPLREISPPPGPPLYPTFNDDANLEPRRRKLPSNTQASSAPSATLVPTAAASTSTSHYFSNPSTLADNTGFNGFNLGLTTAQASQAPIVDDEDDEDLFEHFDDIDFFDEVDDNNDENAPPAQPQLQLQSLTSSATSSFPSTSASSSLNAVTANKTSPSRPLVPEDSIEIVSFTLSPATTRSLARAQGRTQTNNTNNIPKDKGKGKERQTSIPIPYPSPTPGSGPTTGPSNPTTATTFIDASTDIELDPDLLAHLDELDASRFTDPKFVKMQQEEMARLTQARTTTTTTIPSGTGPTRSTNPDKGKGKDTRPVKPLPKTRRSVSSQPQTQSRTQSESQSRAQSVQSQAQNSSSTSKRNEVIEIDDDSSSLSSPPLYQRLAFTPATDNDDDTGIIDDDDSEEEEEDKENMPVMTRHVRRKVVNSEGPGLFGRGQSVGAGATSSKTRIPDDVIELSDED
ncbi:hypothetical protein P691DRAFT_756883 [Macrolepiota fuliginosa MF-IS2]|uniref:RecQ-mediated genome instability protein 1 n=1 Tax=Macrolepiota fuliginosa MF-IS2 TaxID=1400762 RepID=A0A9P6C843_9AGAR|nr:hypothetical protein P691DRAFT_756883 [Macrolepiota fuliginosa MF-IS2]